MYHHEFNLISSKWIFRLENMTELEQKLWIQHLSDDYHQDITDPREIFEQFRGESAIHLNEDVATQELRVRVWNWTGSNGKVYELLDMNAWPGDNESGIIAFDGVIRLKNGDQDLSYFGEPISEFEDRLDFFSEIRQNLSEDPNDRDCWHDEVRDDYEAFFDSQNGKDSCKIESRAWDLYQDKLIALHSEHKRLRIQYANEFEVINQFTSKNTDVSELADKIGYERKLDYSDKLDKNIQFTFTKWIDYDTYLVTIRDHYDTNTYVLNKAGKIDFQMYKSDYLSDNYDPNNDVMRELALRIHAYWDMIINYRSEPEQTLASLMYSGESVEQNMIVANTLPSIGFSQY